MIDPSNIISISYDGERMTITLKQHQVINGYNTDKAVFRASKETFEESIRKWLKQKEQG